MTSIIEAYNFWNSVDKHPNHYNEFLDIFFRDVNPAIVRPTDSDYQLPNLPIVVYECCKLKSSKSIPDAGYVSFDIAQTKIINPDGELNSKQVNTIYGNDSYLRYLVRKQFKEDFDNSISQNDVTVVTTSSKINPFSLPFMSQKHLNIITSNEQALKTTKYKMSGNWATKGIFLLVPKMALNKIINHIKSIRGFNLNPPVVTTPKDLPTLFNYWIKVTGNFTNMINAFTSFYDIIHNEVNNCHTFSYRDGSPYDDPFNKGSISPACFCRGITFYYNNDNWELVRLPMNRGREINICSESQDNGLLSEFYSKIQENAMSKTQILTGKVDGSLLVVCKNKYGIKQDEELFNSSNLLISTKGTLQMKSDMVKYFLEAISDNIESFTTVCLEYMEINNLDSLSFEMVANKRRETVIDYDKQHHGLYFLGGSSGYLFKPFYLLDKIQTLTPNCVNMTIENAIKLPLGPFEEHFEGSIIWVEYDNVYYPLKLKTKMYYMLHKSKNNLSYYDYLLELIDKYGWINSKIPTLDKLPKQNLIVSLFSLVDLPNNIINSFPALKESREEYNKLLEKDPLDHKFRSVYVDGKYWNAYEL